VSWPWIVLLALAVALVIAAEWPRLSGLVAMDARRERERRRRKESFKLIRTDEEEFAESVQRDLSALPTIEERDRKQR
jgi:hypothetical protein